MTKITTSQAIYNEDGSDSISDELCIFQRALEQIKSYDHNQYFQSIIQRPNDAEMRSVQHLLDSNPDELESSAQSRLLYRHFAKWYHEEYSQNGINGEVSNSQRLNHVNNNSQEYVHRIWHILLGMEMISKYESKEISDSQIMGRHTMMDITKTSDYQYTKDTLVRMSLFYRSITMNRIFEVTLHDHHDDKRTVGTDANECNVHILSIHNHDIFHLVCTMLFTPELASDILSLCNVPKIPNGPNPITNPMNTENARSSPIEQQSHSQRSHSQECFPQKSLSQKSPSKSLQHSSSPREEPNSSIQIPRSPPPQRVPLQSEQQVTQQRLQRMQRPKTPEITTATTMDSVKTSHSLHSIHSVHSQTNSEFEVSDSRPDESHEYDIDDSNSTSPGPSGQSQSGHSGHSEHSGHSQDDGVDGDSTHSDSEEDDDDDEDEEDEDEEDDDTLHASKRSLYVNHDGSLTFGHQGSLSTSLAKRILHRVGSFESDEHSGRSTDSNIDSNELLPSREQTPMSLSNTPPQYTAHDIETQIDTVPGPLNEEKSHGVRHSFNLEEDQVRNSQDVDEMKSINGIDSVHENEVPSKLIEDIPNGTGHRSKDSNDSNDSNDFNGSNGSNLSAHSQDEFHDEHEAENHGHSPTEELQDHFGVHEFVFSQNGIEGVMKQRSNPLHVIASRGSGSSSEREEDLKNTPTLTPRTPTTPKVMADVTDYSPDHRDDHGDDPNLNHRVTSTPPLSTDSSLCSNDANISNDGNSNNSNPNHNVHNVHPTKIMTKPMDIGQLSMDFMTSRTPVFLPNDMDNDNEEDRYECNSELSADSDAISYQKSNTFVEKDFNAMMGPHGMEPGLEPDDSGPSDIDDNPDDSSRSESGSVDGQPPVLRALSLSQSTPAMARNPHSNKSVKSIKSGKSTTSPSVGSSGNSNGLTPLSEQKSSHNISPNNTTNGIKQFPVSAYSVATGPKAVLHGYYQNATSEDERWRRLKSRIQRHWDEDVTAKMRSFCDENEFEFNDILEDIADHAMNEESNIISHLKEKLVWNDQKTMRFYRTLRRMLVCVCSEWRCHVHNC